MGKELFLYFLLPSVLAVGIPILQKFGGTMFQRIKPGMQLGFLSLAIALFAFVVYAGIASYVSSPTEKQFDITWPIIMSLITGLIFYLVLYKDRYKIYPNTERPKGSTKIDVTNATINGYANIQSIDQEEPSNHPPLAFDIILTIFAVLILIYGIATSIAWILGKVPPQLDLRLSSILGLFIVLPIIGLLDTWVWERKYYRLGKSAKEAHKTITLTGNLSDIFNVCLKILNERMETRVNSRFWKLRRPYLIRGLIGGLVITVNIVQTDDNTVKVCIHSDSPLVTTKWDFGNNQKNIDKFERFVRAEMEQTSTFIPQLTIERTIFRYQGKYGKSWRVVVRNNTSKTLNDCTGRLIEIADEISGNNPGLGNWPDGYLCWSDNEGSKISIPPRETRELETIIYTGIWEPLLLAYAQGEDYRKLHSFTIADSILLMLSVTSQNTSPIYAICHFHENPPEESPHLDIVKTTIERPDLKDYQRKELSSGKENNQA